jgi:hypothetical protein
MLDKLSAAARHFLLLVLLTGLIAALVVYGNSAVDLGLAVFTSTDTLTDAGDAAVKAAGTGLLAWVALVLTPLTRQYGVGAGEA